MSLVARHLEPPPVPGYNNYRDAYMAITCGDTDNPADLSRYGRVGRHLDATATPYAGSLWANGAHSCGAWTGRATERYTGPWTARTGQRVLVIGNTFDPATPYQNAVRVHRLLPNSALLTVDAVGHTSLFVSTCATALTARYLLTGDTPPTGTVCRQDAEPFARPPAHAGDSGHQPSLLRQYVP